MTLAPRALALLIPCAVAIAPSLAADPASADAAKLNPLQGQIIELVQTGDLDGIRALVQKDPSQANFVGPAGMTPLGIALSRKNVSLVKDLLRYGADPNKPFGALQMHPIQGASATGVLEAVKELLAKGVDVNKADINGGTALHAATLYGFLDIARLLIEKGANVNATFTGGPNKGATPLHFAARSKNIEAVMALAVSSADWSIKWNGKTPAELADAVGAKDIGAYIRSKQKP
jgi:ankyrin repeat protein